MKHRSTNAARFALTGVAFAAACLWGAPSWALGLGRLTVGSALGETLRAEIEVTSISAEEAASLRLRVASPEAYRAAGVDYNSALASSQVQVVRLANGRQVLRVTSDRAVLEPFVDVIIEATWSSGRLVREYTLLFDPPTRTAQAPAVTQQPGATTAPVVTPAPSPSVPLTPPAAPPAAAPPAAASPAAATPAAATPAPAAAPAPAPLAAAPAPAVRSAPPRPAPAEPRPAVASAAPQPAAPAGEGVDEYRVRPGDSLSRIAGRTQRAGVSLDQMLVSLFRGNPDAFSGDNMNRLKSGAVLSVPSAEQAGKLPAGEAREVIVAQSADFAAYRQRLASGATTNADEAPARQARGQVQAQVDDRKAAAANTPDRLRLTQGSGRASAPEAQMSRQTERKDSATRLAELARNVDELKRLQGSTAPAPASPAPAAPAPAAPATPAATSPAPVPAPPAPAPLPAPTVALTPPPVPAPTPVAAPPAPLASAPVAAPPVPARASAPAATPAAAEPGFLDSLMGNSLLLPLGGVLLALLAGLGLYRLRSRSRHPAGETSFLESRLQPDSFFGASGGQRIDTRDAGGGGNSSSMSYSLSQLDAIGDVDPVAEADVYLAYGRDLQAEEILKEAMRSTPERMAIRGKLLEVYAKRRDTKAFELLATQMFNLTHGEGEDWSKAQALGLGIDPENVLYQPGGAPEEVRGAGGQVVAEPLGASTVPYTAPAGPPAFQPASDATLDNNSLDLDLELDMPGTRDTQPATLQPVPPMEATQALTTGIDAHALDFTLDDEKTIPVRRTPPPPAPSPVPADAGDSTLDFDLDSLDDEPRTVALPKPAPAADPTLDFGDFALGGDTLQPDDAPGADTGALARKLELAEEFRQIGDLEGARDLLEEVLAKGDGPLKAKAQGMLDKL